VCILVAFVCLILFGQSQTPKAAKTDDEIKQAIIAELIARYH